MSLGFPLLGHMSRTSEFPLIANLILSKFLFHCYTRIVSCVFVCSCLWQASLLGYPLTPFN